MELGGMHKDSFAIAQLRPPGYPLDAAELLVPKAVHGHVLLLAG